MIHTLTQGHLLPMSTLAACLRCVGRIDFEQGSPSFFRFGGQSVKELRPCRVTDALGKTMMVNHAVDVQVLHTNHAETVHDLPGLLVREIIPTEPNPFMDTRYHLTVLTPFVASFVEFAMRTLDLCQCLLFFSEKAWIRYFFTCRERGKGCESDINPHVLVILRQAFRVALHGKAYVPFARRGAMQSTGLDLATDGAVIDHLETSDFGENHMVIMRDAKAGLWVG